MATHPPTTAKSVSNAAATAVFILFPEIQRPAKIPVNRNTKPTQPRSQCGACTEPDGTAIAPPATANIKTPAPRQISPTPRVEADAFANCFVICLSSEAD